jgi:hypothetical protein
MLAMLAERKVTHARRHGCTCEPTARICTMVLYTIHVFHIMFL